MLLNQITHAPRLRKPCISSDLLTPPQERLTSVKFGQEIHRDRDFHSLHCVYNGCRDKQLNQGMKTLFGTNQKHVEISDMSINKCRLIRKNCVYNV